MNIQGDDGALNDALDDLEYVVFANVLSRRDLEAGKGMLTVQVKGSAREKVIEIARRRGLVAT